MAQLQVIRKARGDEPELAIGVRSRSEGQLVIRSFVNDGYEADFATTIAPVVNGIVNAEPDASMQVVDMADDLPPASFGVEHPVTLESKQADEAGTFTVPELQSTPAPEPTVVDDRFAPPPIVPADAPKKAAPRKRATAAKASTDGPAPKRSRGRR